MISPLSIDFEGVPSVGGLVSARGAGVARGRLAGNSKSFRVKRLWRGGKLKNKMATGHVT
jgi:hypothetical protein